LRLLRLFAAELLEERRRQIGTKLIRLFGLLS